MTRIAALADLHGYQPPVPDADLVIIAGDVCIDRINGLSASIAPDRQAAWFETKMRPWIRRFAVPTLLTWGNHDFIRECDLLGTTRGNLQIVVDELAVVNGLRVWLSPWSNRFMNWNWMKSPEALALIYERIPAGIDILVSHQPPYGCGDRYPNLQSGQYEHVGSQELLAAIRRVAPQVVICGHLHDGYGIHHVDGIPVYNVSVVNEAYQLVHPVTMIELEPRV